MGVVSLKLKYKDEMIGTVEDVSYEHTWVLGHFTPSDGYYKYIKFFEALVCEDGMDETQFDQELLNERNWFIVDGDNFKGIWFPAIYSSGDSYFKYW
jgi:hypothetical protein